MEFTPSPFHAPSNRKPLQDTCPIGSQPSFFVRVVSLQNRTGNGEISCFEVFLVFPLCKQSLCSGGEQIRSQLDFLRCKLNCCETAQSLRHRISFLRKQASVRLSHGKFSHRKKEGRQNPSFYAHAVIRQRAVR